MDNIKGRNPLVFLALICIFILVFSACQPAPTPEVTPTLEATAPPEIPPCQEKSDQWVSGEPANGYIQGQVMITGKAEDIETVIGEVKEFEINIICGIDLGRFSNDPPLSIQLYQIDIPVWDAVRQINEIALAQIGGPGAVAGEGNRDKDFHQIALQQIDGETDFVAVAEPNYETTLPLGGYAHGGSGGIVGSPIGNVQAAAREFSGQWVYQPLPGITLKTNTGARFERLIDNVGEGIEIAVFDTSPLEEGLHEIYWAAQPFELTVSKPVLMFETTGNATSGLKEHGLFVTGLAQGVAPNATYHLIRVLDDSAKGDVATLVTALDRYVGSKKNLQNTVINLSLGLDLEEGGEPDAATKAALDTLRTLLDDSTLPYKQELVDRIGNPPAGAHAFPVFALKALEASYQGQGAVIVAAAGNDFHLGHPDPHIPAAYSGVIGVASSNYDGSASCFSNPGNVGAPSGDGDGTCAVDILSACPSVSGGTPTPCNSAVVSIVSHPPSPSGYAYWTGTSFSTPMVSGLAALILEARGPITPEGVRQVIECSANSRPDPRLGAGIIDVERAMDTSACP